MNNDEIDPPKNVKDLLDNDADYFTSRLDRIDFEDLTSLDELITTAWNYFDTKRLEYEEKRNSLPENTNGWYYFNTMASKAEMARPFLNALIYFLVNPDIIETYGVVLLKYIKLSNQLCELRSEPKLGWIVAFSKLLSHILKNRHFKKSISSAELKNLHDNEIDEKNKMFFYCVYLLALESERSLSSISLLQSLQEYLLQVYTEKCLKIIESQGIEIDPNISRTDISKLLNEFGQARTLLLSLKPHLNTLIANRPLQEKLVQKIAGKDDATAAKNMLKYGYEVGEIAALYLIDRTTEELIRAYHLCI